MVDDDDGDDFPSPEPKTNSGSSLPRKNRRWRWLRIVKRDESFSLIFSSRTWIYGVGVDFGGAPRGSRDWGHAQGGRRAPTLVDRVWAPNVDSFTSIFYIFHWFSGHSDNFYFCTKITPWQFCWKQRRSRLVPFKSCKLESKTRAKVFGKVDTTETYQCCVNFWDFSGFVWTYLCINWVFNAFMFCDLRKG